MGKRKDVLKANLEAAASGVEVSAVAEQEAAPAEASAVLPAEIEATTAATPKIEPAAAESTAILEPAEGMPSSAIPSASNRFALLAASVALAATLGAVCGSLGTMGLSRAPATASASDQNAQHASLTKVTAELAALKTSIEAANRLANTQFSKMTESVSRLEQRVTSAPASAPAPAPAQEVTGSVAAAAAGNAVPKDTSKPVIIDGWVLRDIYRGRALVENRYGLYEVAPGSNLPGIGRIENITQQNGRWVVVTPKGLIVSMR